MEREAGEVTRRETRRRVLRAAAAEFAERGYVGATVARIADRADVAVPTLYSAWGSKRALLRAVMLSTVAGEDADADADADSDADRAAVLLGPDYQQPTPDGTDLLARVAHGIRLVAERSAVGWAT